VRIQVVKYTHGSYVIKQTWKLEELHRIEFYEEESNVFQRCFICHFNMYLRTLDSVYILTRCITGLHMTLTKEAIL
jgi:hypothetical protein